MIHLMTLLRCRPPLSMQLARELPPRVESSSPGRDGIIYATLIHARTNAQIQFVRFSNNIRNPRASTLIGKVSRIVGKPSLDIPSFPTIAPESCAGETTKDLVV